MKKYLFALLLFVAVKSWSIDMLGVYPTNWWVGMKNPKVQIMLHGENIGMFTKFSITYPGVKVEKISKAESKNYVFLDLNIAATTKPGVSKIIMSGGGIGVEDVFFELKPRNKENGKTRTQGVTAKDFIYLMMPDRFSNGDPSNDIINDYRDKTSNRKDKFSRHGGDFKGILNHLDYFNQLGVTTLWLTPVIENDMPLMNEWGNNVAGYHGYWFTDHYNVDRRFGGMKDTRSFAINSMLTG